MTGQPALGWLLMVDGVLNGFGHTGTWLGYQYADVLPDVLTQGPWYRLPTGTCLPQGTAADSLARPLHEAVTPEISYQ